MHAHIGGCYRPNTFMELVLEKGLDLDAIDFYNVNIETAFKFFALGSKLVTDLKTLKRVLAEIIEDYAKQNTRYLELRSTPKAFKESTREDYIRAVVEVMEQAEMRDKIKVRFLVSINRQAPVEDAQASLEAVKLVNSSYVVGVELSGNPKTGTFSDFLPLFTEIRQE